MAKNKKFGNLTRLQAEKISKKNAQELEEKLDLLGQESDTKAAKWVSEYFKEEEKQEKRFRDENLTLMDSLTKNKKKYLKHLQIVFLRFLEAENIPLKYKVYSKVDDKGLVVGIGGTNFQGAIAASGIVQYDFFALKVLAIRVGNTTAKLDGFSPKKGDIFLGDEYDIKKYTSPTR